MLKSYRSENLPNPTSTIEKRFLQVSLFSPLVAPPLIIFIGSPLVLGLEVSGLAALVGFVLIFSLILGGVPYLLFLVGLFAWMRNKETDQVRQMIHLSPLLFIPVLMACALIVGVIGAIAESNPSGLFAGLGLGLFCSVFALILGYSYVGLIDIAFLLFRRCLQATRRLK